MGSPPFASVYQAELHAIQRAIERLESLSIRGPVTIHTDSLSSIFALQAQEIVSLQCGETIRAINRYGRRNDLRIHWIKAHVGNPWNERADKLAKQGTFLPPQSHIALSVRSRKKMYHEHMRSQWLSLWKNCRRTTNVLGSGSPRSTPRIRSAFGSCLARTFRTVSSGLQVSVTCNATNTSKITIFPTLVDSVASIRRRQSICPSTAFDSLKPE